MRTLGLITSLITSLVTSVALALGCGGAPKSPPSTPQASGGAAPGTAAPDAQLTDTSGAKVALASVLHRRAETVVVFYRGFW